MVPIVFRYIFILSLSRCLNARIGIFEVSITDTVQLRHFVKLASDLNWHLWTRPSLGRPVRFTNGIDTENINYLREKLALVGLSIRIINDNLDKKIYDEVLQNVVQRSKALYGTQEQNGIETYFASHEEYNQWLRSLRHRHSELVSLRNIGKSYEGRDMIILKMSIGPGKKAIFLEGGMHAREWLAVSSVVWILNKMISGYTKNDSTVKEALNTFDFYFLPVTNPDGYEITRLGGHNRLWRKNTMPVGNGCYGVDLNRNFDTNFGQSDVGSDPCDLIYPGVTPFSTPETINFQDFVQPLKNDIKLFLSFHSYGQLLLTPSAYTQTPPSDNKESMRVANIMADAIFKISGVKYEVGEPAELLYTISGDCNDWIKQIGIPYSYTFEVRPRGDSSVGFLAPVTLIGPTGNELFGAVMAAARAVK